MLSQRCAEDLVDALRLLARRSRLLDVTARGADPDALPTWLASLLANLEIAECTRLGELAERLGVTASTLSRQIAHAESLGYAVRTPDPDDRRAANVALTADGAAALGRHRAGYIALLREAIPEWTDHDAEELVELLTRLGDAIGAAHLPS